MDNQLLKQLYLKYHREIYLYLFSLCRNPDTAQDLTQETFLKALLSLQDHHANMRAWLYMVARNLFFNQQRKEKRSVPLEPLEETLLDENAAEELNQLIRDERSRLLYQALQHLGEQKREILTLQYYANLSQKQIAILLKLSPENVRVLAHRGKREIKQYMEENGYDLS